MAKAAKMVAESKTSSKLQILVKAGFNNLPSGMPMPGCEQAANNGRESVQASCPVVNRTEELKTTAVARAVEVAKLDRQEKWPRLLSSMSESRVARQLLSKTADNCRPEFNRWWVARVVAEQGRHTDSKPHERQLSGRLGRGWLLRPTAETVRLRRGGFGELPEHVTSPLMSVDHQFKPSNGKQKSQGSCRDSQTAKPVVGAVEQQRQWSDNQRQGLFAGDSRKQRWAAFNN